MPYRHIIRHGSEKKKRHRLSLEEKVAVIKASEREVTQVSGDWHRNSIVAEPKHQILRRLPF